MKLAVVLVSPKTPGNVGAAARAMLNMGVSDLRIVAPRCDFKDSQSRAMAVHAAELLDRAQVFDTLREAVADRDLVVGTSARLRGDLAPPQHPAQVRPLVQAANAPALVYGPEESGLSNADLELCRVTVRVPTAEYASLNLSQAVLLTCYEFLQSDLQPPAAPLRPLASSGELEGMYTHLQEAMLLTGYTDAKRARHTMRMWRVALDRAQLDSAEVRLIRGFFRQVQWKVGQAGRSAVSGQESAFSAQRSAQEPVASKTVASKTVGGSQSPVTEG